ncbi:energy-coupling factor transporter transmembrane component T family protein [Lucifera butyrica]|uniref:energy-coupling factor transporter transmembrane component T family protein n=1 Tax=Lucifera butyrica TaxID=1351585 RepID=UPI001A9EB38D|nr:energy-coupling factor transporter transmembrane component T [Lucifera butyrica]
MFVEKNTMLHRLNPLSKLLYVFAAIIVPLLSGSNAVSLLVAVVSLFLLLWGKIFRKIVPLMGFSLLILLSIVVIQGMYKAGNHTPLLTLGSVVFYKEGIRFSAEICLQVLNMLEAFSLLVLTTKPTDLIEALVSKGLSAKLGYVLSSVLQIIPQMAASMDTIIDAQRSRGMKMEGNLLTRVRAFIPLIGPVVMTSLISVKERAMALEVRCFNSSHKKTFLTIYQVTPQDQWFRGMVFLSMAGALAWRIMK